MDCEVFFFHKPPPKIRRAFLPITDIFLLENSATPPRAVALRPCEAERYSLLTLLRGGYKMPRQGKSFSSRKNSFCFASSELHFSKGEIRPRSPPPYQIKKEKTPAKQKRMRGGEARAERRSGNGAEHIPCARWSGCYGVTESVVERTITFQITTRSEREIRFNDKFLLK